MAAGNHISPIAGPSQGAFLASSQRPHTPDPTANRLNQQFFAGYSGGPPLTTPPTLLPAQPTAGPTPMNGAPGILPPLSQYLPPGPSGPPPAGYTSAYEERRENGEAAGNPASEGYRPPHGEQNGQDVEMGEAGAGGFGGGFTAVNR